MSFDWNLVLGPFGLLVVLILIGLAGYAGKWRFGREYDAMVVEKDKQINALTVDRDEWKTSHLQLLQSFERQSEASSTIATATLRGRKAASSS